MARATVTFVELAFCRNCDVDWRTAGLPAGCPQCGRVLYVSVSFPVTYIGFSGKESGDGQHP